MKVKQLNKRQLHMMKQVEVIRRHYPINNMNFIAQTKKDIIKRYGTEALSELEIDLAAKTVSFRGGSVALVDDSKPMSELTGVVTFRSKDYYFTSGLTKSYGEIDAYKVNDNGWRLDCYDGSYYMYELANSAKLINGDKLTNKVEGSK